MCAAQTARLRAADVIQARSPRRGRAKVCRGLNGLPMPRNLMAWAWRDQHHWGLHRGQLPTSDAACTGLAFRRQLAGQCESG